MTEFRAVAAGPLESPHRFVADPAPALVGMSAAMNRLRADVLHAAAHNGPVLVTGEPGVGKSLVARALHQQGPRAHQLCAVIACQAFPQTLLEVELFGCAKGSMTGATCDRRGILEMVGGGTVILENIEAMSPRTQAALERFLSTGRVHALGTVGSGTPVDARVVATTTLPLDNAVSDRRLQELWARLEQSTLHVPTLRDRRADVPLLAQFFSSSRDHGHAGVVFSAEAMAALSSYPWPGNVTQLQTVVERLAVSVGNGQVHVRDLPVGIRPRAHAARGRSARRGSVGEELFARLRTTGESFWSAVYPLFMKREITRTDLRDLTKQALDAARGDTDGVVRLLNMPGSDQQKFQRFLRKYGCEPSV